MPSRSRLPLGPGFAPYWSTSANNSCGYISQLEHGIMQPKAPALALLNVIKRKGFEAIP